MSATYEFEYSVRKGLGPEWVNKPLTVFLDDLPQELTDYEIECTAINEAETRLRNGGFTKFEKLTMVKS